MGTENWFERYKRRRAEKKMKKLRQKFGFLIEEYKLGQEYTVSELKKHQEVVASSNTLRIEQKTGESAEAIEKLLETRVKEMLEFQKGVKTDLLGDKDEVTNLLVEISKKIDEFNASDFQNQERITKALDGVISSTVEGLDKSAEKIETTLIDKFSLIQNSINQSQNRSADAYQGVKQVLQKINSQLEMMQKSAREIVDAAEVTIDERVNGIILSIEDLKTLMKVVAVNNLLDEI